MSFHYEDTWSSCKAAIVELKKNNYKRSDCDRFIPKLMEYGKIMEDEKAFENAAVAHAEIAKIYKLIDNPVNRQKHLMIAGDLVVQHLDNIEGVQSFSNSSHFAEDAYKFFNEAMVSAIDDNCKGMAAMYALGGASKLRCALQISLADKLFHRAFCLHEGNLPMQTHILWSRAELHLDVRRFQVTLSIIEDIWNLILASNDQSPNSHKQLRQCEVISAIILSRTYKKIISSKRNEEICEIYLIGSGVNNKKAIYPDGRTYLTPGEFEYFANLISLYRDSDFEQISKQLKNRDYKFIHGLVENVCIIFANRNSVHL